jgi:hypothetical protein
MGQTVWANIIALCGIGFVRHVNIERRKKEMCTKCDECIQVLENTKKEADETFSQNTLMLSTAKTVITKMIEFCKSQKERA